MLDYQKEMNGELKRAIVAANESGLLATNIRYVGVKGDKLYSNFIDTIGKLDAEKQMELPEETIEFYNYAISDPLEEEEEEEEEEETLEELNFDDSNTDVIEEPEIDEGVKEALELGEESNEVTIPIEEPVKEVVFEMEPNLDVEPQKKMQRLAKTPMTVTVVDKVLTIIFRELGTKESYDLPEPSDIAVFKPVRKEAINFAKEQGATAGQVAAICKILNQAGYYTR